MAPTKPNGTIDNLLSARKVREVLDCSDRCLRRWIQSGRIPAPLRIGRQLRWKAGAIAEFVNSLER